jgi:hypothetical protein
MRKVTIQEFLEECRIWDVSPPKAKEIEDALKNETSVCAAIVGVYYPSKEELYDWKITPSSEDKGYSSY